MNTINNNEKNLINIIKYGAVIPIITLSILFTYIFIQYKNDELKKEINDIKIRFLNENKKDVKEEVDRVVNSINYEIKKSDIQLKAFLKRKVYEAHGIATRIYNSNIEHGNKNKKEIFEIIKNVLGSIRYSDGRGYIFIDDKNGIKLLQPKNKEFEGKDFSNFEDPNGYKFVQTIIKTIKNKTETYDKYFWYKSASNEKAFEKMSFYKYFAPYDVAIGAGEYLVDFKKQLQKKMLDRIQRIKFKDNGYVAVFDSKGTYLSHFKTQNIGKDGFKVRDEKGRYFIKEFINFAKKNDEGFISYVASSKPNGENENRRKISYVKYFKNWDWVILSGFYLEELNKEIKIKEAELTNKYEKIIQKIIGISFIVTLALILFSFYISRIIFNRFKDYKEELEKEVDKTIENEKLLIQQSKMAIMGEMIGNIAYQWKQPLNLISTSNSLIKLNREIEDFSTEEQIEEAIKNIDDSVIYLAGTIDDFKTYFNPSKIKSVFRINDIFNKSFKLLNLRFEEHKIEVITEIDKIEVYGYENEMLQVFINILKNSIDELTKIEDNRVIFISVTSDKEKAYIKIKDNAGGIAPDLLTKVFQAHFTTKKNKGAKGIDLYMCKQIVNSLKGEISACNIEFEYKSKLYEGAQFTIELPIDTSI